MAEKKDKEDFAIKTAILAKALTRYGAIVEDCNKLSEDVKAHFPDDLEKIGDADVAKLVHKIKDWKEKRDKLVAQGRDLAELTVVYKLTPERTTNYENLISNIDNAVKTAVERI